MPKAPQKFIDTQHRRDKVTASNSLTASQATIMAGIPEVNAALYWRIRFAVGDPAAFIELRENGLPTSSILILRDIEMGRARQKARADQVSCPADFAPEGGLSGDRETATAQAAAECLRRAGVECVTADRTLPLIFAEVIRQTGIQVECDLEMGVVERRSKDEEEIGWIREAQRVTEGAVQMACELIARAEARKDGVLLHEGEVFTSERVRTIVDVWFLERQYSNPTSIIAGGQQGADCHNVGSGALKTGEPVIIDIFPTSRASRYNGDCTRTVVHGDIPDAVARMHSAVREAKAAGIAAIRPGTSGEAVHLATTAAITRNGYAMGLPKDDSPDSYCAMTHGTGHGVGLDVHEPPLLDMNGPELVVGDVVTVEPGLYTNSLGGVRVEDMVLVTEQGCENLNMLHEGLEWR
jgi:Xaa-Pro aminopeptidase